MAFLTFFICHINIYSYNGDLTFATVNTAFSFTFQAVSIPFEGITNRTFYPSNRLDLIFNGCYHRRFEVNNTFRDWGINYRHLYLSAGAQIILLGSMWDDLGGYTDSAWGFAKYKVTMQRNDGVVFWWYWNSLDTKYGKDSIYGIDYRRDWVFSYNSSLQAFILSSDNTYYDTLYQSESGKEYKVWELLYNRQEPWEKNFKARTTPFPINPEILYTTNNFRQLILGTKVTLDTVYNYLGDLDRYGYNTVINFWSRDYYSNPPIIQGYNDSGNTFCTPAWNYAFEKYGMRITAVNGDTMVLKNNKKLWISGMPDINTQELKGDTIIFSTGSTLIKESNSQINTCNAGCFSDSGANTSWASGSFHRAFEFSEIGYYGNLEHTVNSGGHIEIMGNAKLKVGDNTILTFDGNGTYLELKSGSRVEFGDNAKIQFKNGAKLIADHCTFTQIESGKIGYGIVFDNPGTDNSVKNCTFNNILRPLSGRNVFSLLCQDNTFNLLPVGIGNPPSGGIGILFQNFIVAGSGEDGITYNLNFIHNTFNDGYIGMFLGGYASDNVIAYIDNNTFNNVTLGWNLALRKVSGDVKNNNMKSNSNNYSMGLWFSNPNLYNNIVENNNGQSNYGNCAYLSMSNPVMAPASVQGGGQNQNQLMWTSGLNRFTSLHKDDIHISVSKPVIENGINSFVVSNSNYYHFYGPLGESPTTYNGRNNCWYGNNGIVKSHVYYVVYYPPEQCSIVVVPINVTPSNISCNDQINFTGFDVYPRGDYYDTVYYSDDNSGIPVSEDEALFSQAEQHRLNNEYFEQIIELKDLLDNYPSSQYIYTSLSALYTAYEQLDTSNQQHRDFIFSELKNFYNLKIQQYSSDFQFIDIAYQLVLMCETKIDNYNEALTGYEFISLYHPDPEARLQASMDYGEIQALLYGSGGESNQPKVINQSKILKLMDKTPVGKIVRNAYKKMENLNKGNPNNDNPQNNKSANELKDRAKYNIANSRGLTKKERDQRREEDIKLLIKYEPVQSDNISFVPKQYSLSQNYPNPFNPTTKITYNIPRDSKVKLIVYDILGREITRLINDELKLAGSYTIEFNGANLSSGVYFYRLESGDYSECKKMVLIK